MTDSLKPAADGVIRPPQQRGAHRRLQVLILVSLGWLSATMVAATERVDFSQQIRPILEESCFSCHGHEKQKGKLRLDHKSAAFAGSKNGAVIVPGKAEESPLYKRLLLPKENDERMPNEGEPLSSRKVELIRDWINQGAVWPDDQKEPPVQPAMRVIPRKKTDLEVADKDLLPVDRAIGEVIDHYLDARIVESKTRAAAQADDATVLRRLTLDLAGRIPTAEEAQAYGASEDPGKRAALIDRLSRSPWFYRHVASELTAMLRGADGAGPDVREYLLKAMRENRPWLRIFRELLGEGTESPGAELFLTKRLNDPDLLTRDLSSMMFGINLSCCQCHTHPYVDTLTQDFFLGTKSFFARCYEFQGTLREKQFGPGKAEYKTKSGRTVEVGLKFINGAVVEAPQPNVPDLTKAVQEENKRIEELKKNFEKTKEYPPEPFFSLRRQFVQTSERPENQILLARSIVNRLWYRLYGYGLVMLVDQMHSQNPASHPELLRWLSRDLISHNWDLRRLITGMVSSHAYSRSSRWEEGTAPPRDLFAVANLRPLTPLQFGMSVMILGESLPAGTNTDLELLEKRIVALEAGAQSNFVAIIDPPREGFQIDMEEPLGMSNDPDRLKVIAERLTPQLSKLPVREDQVRSAVWSVLGRPPRMEELELLGRYLMRHSTVAENERAEAAAAAVAQSQAIVQAKARVEEIRSQLAALEPVGSAGAAEARSTPGTLQSPAQDSPTPAPAGSREAEVTVKRSKLQSEMEEWGKVATKSAPTVPRNITSSTALEQLVWSLISSAEFRFNH